MPFRTKKQFDLLPLSVLKISVKWLQPKQGISFHNENLLGGSNFHAINLSQLETICSFSTVHIHSASHLVPNMWVQWSGGGACLLYNGEVRLWTMPSPIFMNTRISYFASFYISTHSVPLPSLTELLKYYCVS